MNYLDNTNAPDKTIKSFDDDDVTIELPYRATLGGPGQ